MKATFMPKLITILSGLGSLFFLWMIYGAANGLFMVSGSTTKYFIRFGLCQAMMIFGIVMWRKTVKMMKKEKEGPE